MGTADELVVYMQQKFPLRSKAQTQKDPKKEQRCTDNMIEIETMVQSLPRITAPNTMSRGADSSTFAAAALHAVG